MALPALIGPNGLVYPGGDMLRVYAVAGGFDADAQAVIDEMDVVGTAPDGARQTVINDFVLAMKAAGHWAKSERVYTITAHEDAPSRIDWKNPGSNMLALHNTPVFTVDSGWKGSATGLLRDATNLSTLTLYQRDDCHACVFVVADAVSIDGPCVGQVSGGASMQLWPRRSSGYFRSRLNHNAGSFDATNGADDLGLFTAVRTASNAVESYRNGTSLGTGTDASTGVAASPLSVCGVGTSPSDHVVGFVSIGSQLSATEVADLYTAVNAYMTAVGAV